ncbi:MAG: M20 family metallopeptidase [Planctomycetia bacterium]|nr:M20 family metallopeptidase [Planctomycetia bacterium]
MSLLPVCRKAFPRALAFAQKLVRTRSMPGQEEEIARIVAREMSDLGYDSVEVDGAGNVIGTIRGGSGPVLMLNGHMDHVSPGEESAWKSGGPFGGAVARGRLWGRGATDMKGALAMMVHAGGVLKRAGAAPEGDVIVAAVVMEETGGLGTRYLLEHGRRPDLCVVGEPTDGGVRIGHRGRMAVWVTFRGRAGHASMPALARNPNYDAARFLAGLEKAVRKLPRHAVLGPSTIAPTLYQVDATSSNVIPGVAKVFLDWRSTVERPVDAAKWLRRHVGGRFEVDLPRTDYRSWTGYGEKDVTTTQEGFVTPKGHPLVKRVAAAVGASSGRAPRVGVWRFATDGRLTSAAGIPTVGYSPAEEAGCHVADESVPVAGLKTGLGAYAMMAFGNGHV